jgi:glycosidase
MNKIKQMKTIYTLILLTFSIFKISGQPISKIEPPFWYVGMNNTNLQLLIYGKDIGKLKPKIEDSKAIIKKINKVDNENYLFIDLDLKHVKKAENISIDWYQNDNIVQSTQYQLKERERTTDQNYTFDSKDVIYLITPDRFSNGDPSNDNITGMREQGVDRVEEYARHGGDIAGIINHLDYIEKMGFTAIWLNPVLENDQPQWSYHGYAITDYYSVDKRFGDNEQYKLLATEAKKKGIGLIMDMVANHCGSNHWWMEDLPTEDWVNFQNEKYQGSNHRRTTLIDPYASKSDRDLMVKGWFVPTMPDLNQENKLLANYIIQNSIWWIEYAHLYGIRQDTYPYPYKEFMKDWTCRILEEYPNFNIVGEEWSFNPTLIAYWQKGKENSDGYSSCLRSIMDFPLNIIIVQAFKEKESWDKGLIKLYENLSADYNYVNPNDIMVFADNHDMSRIATIAEEDASVVRMVMGYILTTRGIPQILYGTELLMAHMGTDSHGAIRADFPGGWKGDPINAFSGKGLSNKELDFQNWMQKILNWRKTKHVIHHGKLMHYAPENGSYVYFRYNESETVMVVFNKNDHEINLELDRFEERLNGFKRFKNIFTGKDGNLGESLNIPKKSVQIFEIIKG